MLYTYYHYYYHCDPCLCTIRCVPIGYLQTIIDYSTIILFCQFPVPRYLNILIMKLNPGCGF